MTIGGRQGQAPAPLATPGSSAGKPPLKARDLLGSKNSGSMASLKGSMGKASYQKEMARRHKKSLVITLLLKIQALGLPSINSAFLRDLIFEKTSEFKGIYGYFNKGHLELLKTYGEPDTLIADYDLDPQVLEQKRLEQQVAAENSHGVGHAGSRRANPHQQSSPYTQGSVKQRSGTPSRAMSQKGSENAAEDQDRVVAIYEEQEENSR